MKLKDIVNRDLVTLTNCESEPIHIPGAIQPHGFLLAVKTADGRIDFCSGNTTFYCGIEYTQLLGQSFEQAFGNRTAEHLKDYLTSDEMRDGEPVALQLGQIAYSCTIHQVDGHIVIDAEPFPDGFRNLPDLYRQTRKFVALLEHTQTLQQLSQTIAEETRRITGYDRVMIYRFDKDFNGEVFAEAVRDDLEPFLNLHYPHTDIPAQARELYLRNLLRMIVDVDYTPVPIYTVDDGSDKNLDLSKSVLRSVSPIHIEYLRNMGVGATMSISLIQDKKLWGLIACHHYSAKNIPHYTRLSAQLQGHFLTSQISVREAGEAFEAGKGIAASLDALLEQTAGLSEDQLGEIVARPELLHLAGASAVALMFQGQLYVSGEPPEEDTIRRLGSWLAVHHAGGSFVTDRLGNVYDTEAAPAPMASGLLYQALTADGKQFIIWFRKEQQTDVFWAGDPEKAIIKDGAGLSPRKSFEKWKAQTTLQSREWTDAEQTAAANFAYALQKQLNLILLSAEEQRYRKLTEQLQQANAELESINWISTHDLQEPLRKIQVFASRVLDRPANGDEDNDTRHAVDRMRQAANRMQALLTDIHAFSKIIYAEDRKSLIDLNDVVAQVIREDIADELGEQHAEVTTGTLPEVMGEAFLLRQLVTNILRNAIKFTADDRAVRIRISADRMDDSTETGLPPAAGGYHRINIEDNGIGFSNDYAESIFGLFKRLHNQRDYNGTGIGLAICRKIMQRHDGLITATGIPGTGATFSLWFPVLRPAVGTAG